VALSELAQICPNFDLSHRVEPSLEKFVAEMKTVLPDADFIIEGYIMGSPISKSGGASVPASRSQEAQSIEAARDDARPT
jgi:hypothetical protein